MSPSRQLTLNLGHRPALGRQDFVVAASNDQAVAWLDRWPDWPAIGLMLVGPPGCGKSHLLAAFALAHKAQIVSAPTLRIPDVPHIIEGAKLVLVDDLDKSADQDALFHLYNLAVQHNVGIVFAAHHSASRLGLYLPDLESRLRALPHVEIKAPDDDLLASVIVKQFSDRQISLTPEVLTYLLGRMERSFDAARRMVEALDQASLAEGKPVTIPLARKVLG